MVNNHEHEGHTTILNDAKNHSIISKPPKMTARSFVTLNSFSHNLPKSDMSIAHKSNPLGPSQLKKGNRNLTAQQIENIKYRLMQGESPSILAELLGISSGTIWSIASRYNINLNTGKELSDDEIVFGFKVNSYRTIKDFPDYDQETKDSFSELLKQHTGLIHWCINQYFIVDKEELFQICSIFLYKHFCYYNPAKGAFAQWCTITTKSIIAIYLKKQIRWKNRMGAETKYDVLGYFEEEYDNYVDEKIASLEKAIGDLPEPARTIIKLYLGGYRSEGIAARLNINSATVNQYIFYIKHSIFQYREKYFEGIKVTEDKFKIKGIKGRNLFESRKSKGHSFNLPNERIELIKELLATHTADQVSLITNHARAVVVKIRKHFNIPPLFSQNRLTDTQRSDILLLLKTKISFKKIADIVGCSDMTISNMAKAYGYQNKKQDSLKIMSLK
jgi:RNA polymerase sigma factor (sigma-70 family)